MGRLVLGSARVILDNRIGVQHASDRVDATSNCPSQSDYHDASHSSHADDAPQIKYRKIT